MFDYVCADDSKSSNSRFIHNRIANDYTKIYCSINPVFSWNKVYSLTSKKKIVEFQYFYPNTSLQYHKRRDFNIFLEYSITL